MPRAESAVRLANLIATRTQSPLTLLHTYEDDQERGEGEETLAQARQILSKDLSVETHLLQGDPLEVLRDESKAGDYDLVVLMASRRRFLRRSLPTDHAMLQRPGVSVLVVKPPAEDLKRILICTGGLKVNEGMIAAGGQLAQAVGAEVVLLHVSSPVPSMYTGLDEIEETLEELLKTDTPIAKHLRRGAEILSDHGLEAEVKLRHGVAVEEIIRETQRVEYDLIVVGASGATEGVKEWLLGDVTQRIVDQCVCPILVVGKTSINIS
jgi:nucleotide-binding universal stress UspA family protein